MGDAGEDGLARTVWFHLDQPGLGDLVALLRRHSGLSQDALAQRIAWLADGDTGIEDSVIGRWEHHRTGITLPYRRLLARVAEREVAQMDPISRRGFLDGLAKAAGLGTLATIGGLGTSDPQRLVGVLTHLHNVDGQVVEDLRSVTAEYARRSHTEGPAQLLIAVNNHLAVVRSAMNGARSAEVAQLASVGGETARLAGWLSYLLDQRSGADAYYNEAIQLSEAAGDQILLARQLVAKSLLYSSLSQDRDGDAGTMPITLSLLEQASSAAEHAPARLRSWIRERLAEEHAADGNGAAAHRELVVAERIIDIGDPEERLPQDWDSIWLDSYRSYVAILLDRPQEAIPLLEGALRDTRSDFTYDRVVFSTSLASAYHRKGETDHAAGLLLQALDMARATRLTGRVNRIVSLRRRMGNVDTAALRRLDDGLRSAMRP